MFTFNLENFIYFIHVNNKLLFSLPNYSFSRRRHDEIELEIRSYLDKGAPFLGTSLVDYLGKFKLKFYFPVSKSRREFWPSDLKCKIASKLS